MPPGAEPPLLRSSSWLRKAGRSTLGLVFPECCELCGDGLPSIEEAEDLIGLCESCRLRLLNDDREACLGCGCPVGPYLPTQTSCLKCQRAAYKFHEVIRLGLYRDDLRSAVIKGKAPAEKSLCVALARYLALVQRERLEAVKADVVIPVPSFWLKRIYSPHHQADILADVLAYELDLPLRLSAIHKVRRTADQSDLPREQRLRNLSGAFRVPVRRLVRGRTVLLVDDVLTTRTTANECARALRKAGAKRVVVAAIAAVE